MHDLPFGHRHLVYNIVFLLWKYAPYLIIRRCILLVGWYAFFLMWKMSYNKVRCLCFRRKNIYLDVTINNEFILWYFIWAIKEASITEKNAQCMLTINIPVWSTSESCLLFKYFERQYRLFRKCMFFKHIYRYILIRNWINIIAILAGYLTEEKKWFAIEIWLLFHGVFCVCCFTERYYNSITLGKVYPILILSLHIFIFVFFF